MGDQDKQLFLVVMEADTGAWHIVSDHLENVNLKDWNATVELAGEIEDMVHVLTATE